MEENFKRGRGHVWAGLFLLIVGGILLLRAMGVLFPYWLFTWPVILIAVGLFIGLRHGFRGPAWFILILIGSAFLLDEAIPGISLRNFILPFIILALGVLFILRPKFRHHRFRHNRFRHGRFGSDWREPIENQEAGLEGQPSTAPFGGAGVETGTNDTSARTNDFIDITTAFGGVKKIVLSKNLRGGDITTFMGGAEIDLRQADFNNTLLIDATNIFGGTKLIIPSSWDVHSEIVAIFGGVDDKRQVNGQNLDPTKIVRLEGTCLFGGIEIRSY